jgi:long-chain acyl-CoA synthetase
VNRAYGLLAAAAPATPAIVAGGTGEAVSYERLEHLSRRLARLFHEHGLRPGDHIAVLMDNTPDYLVTCWAGQRSGLHYTPVNWHLTTEEAAYIVGDCGARALVASPAVAELAATVCARTPAVELRLLAGDGPIGEDVSRAGFRQLYGTVAAYPDDPLPDETEGAMMVYSSGTTGMPKGVERPLSGKPFGNGGPFDQLLAQAYGFEPGMVFLCPAPLYHAAPVGWAMAVHRCGGTVVIMERFEPLELLRLVERYAVTHAWLVPTMFVRLLKLPDQDRKRYDLGSLRSAVHAAAPCPVPVKRRMLEWWGPIIHEFYAGSEGNGFCVIGPEEWLRRPGSVGRPILGRVHITDEEGAELPAGEIGTVWFEGAGNFVYHNDPGKTTAAYDARGWSTLGDLGRLDDEGYLHLEGRRTDLIISGGVNIYPQEVENLLALHPEVADVAVIGVPDEEMGQQVRAVVQPADPEAAGPELAERIIAYCRDRIAHFKCPRTVAFVPELPRLSNGKLLKRRLREQPGGYRRSEADRGRPGMTG